MRQIKASLFQITLALSLILLAEAVSANNLTVYSSRKSELITPILQKFSSDSGVDVSYIYGKPDSLIKLMIDEGDRSPADILLTSDVGTLINAKNRGVLRATKSSILSAQIPALYRSSEGFWYGLTLRARTLVYSKTAVDPSTLSGYEDLADPRWRGRVCMRSSESIYNRSLIAALIERWGEEKTENWAKGVVANLAHPPKGGDRDQIRSIANGECDLTLANSYYYAIMIQSEEERDRRAVEKTGVFWPNQGSEGTHINISGGGVAKHAPHPLQATRLLEYLVSSPVQLELSQTINEYPMIPGIPVSNTLAEMGSFAADGISLDNLAAHNEAVLNIIKAAGWK